MAPVMERGELEQVDLGMPGEATSCLTTTLYDVIATIQDGLRPDDDVQVVASVVHLLRSGRLTWAREASVHLDQTQPMRGRPARVRPFTPPIPNGTGWRRLPG